MKSVGIITIHRINNYGSVLQAYSLQKICENLGYRTEIIDYIFPNQYHKEHCYKSNDAVTEYEPIWIKFAFAKALVRQHRSIHRFITKYQRLSANKYNSPEDLENDPPLYDIYITGSDQLWNPRHCGGDPSFLLHFAPERAKRISYAASISADTIPIDLVDRYRSLLKQYQHISVREKSSLSLIKELINKEADQVVDPTLLLNREDWDKIAVKKRIIRRKYILCYFLNYSFNAYPYADQLAEYYRRETGFELVKVARPPFRIELSHTRYKIGASPEEFLSLVRDAELVLTTSFHGTAFAINYGKPVFTIVEQNWSKDSRQSCLMQSLGLERQILPMGTYFPDIRFASYDVAHEQAILEEWRQESLNFLRTALRDE